jgi:hypothetical protein
MVWSHVLARYDDGSVSSFAGVVKTSGCRYQIIFTNHAAQTNRMTSLPLRRYNLIIKMPEERTDQPLGNVA